ncbi:LysR family transcriptional regulator [Tahibacter caeni]|uniref:LysR family transcriptional regulator n=1 Tax=Tahibacter caeni TaxID=1453545 RepID=UPI00214725BF|nr:LysR family transcriptional regulator [Tahibacter caeni]
MLRDFNETLIFVRVVEQGGFSAAARALGLPKTSVSRKVQELEDRLGLHLLKRTTRRIGLTEAGALYYEHCRHIARDLDAAESAVNQLHGAPRGWLRVTAPYSLGSNSVAPILPEFQQRHPELRVELVLSNDKLDLIGSDIDLALRVGTLADSTFSARRLGSFVARVYASPDYLARNGEPLRPDELVHHRTLAMSQHRGANGRYCWGLRNGDDGGEAVDYAVAPVFVANDPGVLRTALIGGQGLALISDGLVEPLVAAGKLRRVLGAWQSPAVDLNAVYPPGRSQLPKVRVFVDFLLERMSLTEWWHPCQQMAQAPRFGP